MSVWSTITNELGRPHAIPQTKGFDDAGKVVIALAVAFGFRGDAGLAAFAALGVGVLVEVVQTASGLLSGDTFPKGLRAWDKLSDTLAWTAPLLVVLIRESFVLGIAAAASVGFGYVFAVYQQGRIRASR